MQQNNIQYKPRKNNQIKISPVRLINNEGINIGIVSLQEALKQAKDVGLDLVEINGKSSPPIVKITNFGKLLYDEKKKTQAAKKNQVTQELKEIVFRSNTDTNDLEHKLTQAKGFLQDNHRVKFVIKFRGREITHANLGREKIQWFLDQLKDLIQPNPVVSLEGKFMNTTVSPIKQK